MTEENTTGEQPQGSQQPGNPPEGFIEIGRYTGLVQKIDTMVKADKNKDATLLELQQKLQRFEADLIEKDATNKVAVSERDRRLEETVTAKSQMELELKRLRALEAKVEVANEIGHPELLGAIKNLPDLENRDALKLIFEDIANFADTKAQEREKQLMAGVTANTAGVKTNSIGVSPSTEAEWNGHISKQQLGTPEYQQALDNYWAWQMSKQK